MQFLVVVPRQVTLVSTTIDLVNIESRIVLGIRSSHALRWHGIYESPCLLAPDVVADSRFKVLEFRISKHRVEKSAYGTGCQEFAGLVFAQYDCVKP
jgi:hypothetical protein